MPGELAVAPGDTIAVSLPDKAMTGSIWEPVVDEHLLRVVDDAVEARAMPRGAPGRRTLTFEVLGTGAPELRLVRRRRWEKEPRETFVVRLGARGA